MNKKVLTLFSVFILSIATAFSQPSWVAGTPSVASTGPLSITMNYGINMAGRVYIIVINYVSVAPALTSADVRFGALSGPVGSQVATAVLDVNAGNINNILQTTLFVK